MVLTISESSNFINFEIWNNGLPFTEEALKDGEKLFYTEKLAPQPQVVVALGFFTKKREPSSPEV